MGIDVNAPAVLKCYMIFDSRVNGVRYIYYSQMFLLAVALISLTLFLVWATHIIENCYRKAEIESGSMGFPHIPKNSTFFKNNEDFCYKLLHHGVSEH